MTFALHEDGPAAADTVRVALSARTDDAAIIDAEACELVKPYKWSLHHCGKGKLYARAQRHPVTKDNLLLYMHRFLMRELGPPPPGDGYVVDHINGNGLDNRLSNLRWLLPYDNRWRYARHGR